MSEQTTSHQYATVVGRTEELARLQAQAERRKSMLVFGPEGVGKTRLLQQFADQLPMALYVRRFDAPHDLMLSLVHSIQNHRQKGIRLPANPNSLSTSSLRGVVQRALDAFPFVLVLDQLAGPSRVSTGIIKELNYYDRTPVFFAARTPHMEDIGSLQPMCADRSERVELKNFAPPVALEFARLHAQEAKLQASNLEHALHSIVEWSQGNPGSILQMIKMAALPKYRTEDQIKVHVLYLDHLMGRR